MGTPQRDGRGTPTPMTPTSSTINLQREISQRSQGEVSGRTTPSGPAILEKDEREEFLKRENELQDSIAEKETQLADQEKLLASLTNQDLRDSLALIRRAMEKVWAGDMPRIIQDYTDHGEKHCERLADGHGLALTEHPGT